MPEQSIDAMLQAKVDEAMAPEVEQQARENEKAQIREHVTRWHERIKLAREHDKKYFKQWAEDRKIMRGDFGDCEVSVNLIQAVSEVIAAYLYAKNPDQNTRPSDSVDRARFTEFRMFAKTLEIIVSRLLKYAGLKRKAKKMIRASMTVGPSWIKAAMQTRTEKDPVMTGQINDLKTQVDNIRSGKIMISEDEGNREIKEQEIKANITALEAQQELTIAEGLVLDIMKPEDVTVARECGEIEDYLDSPWICYDVYKSKEETLAITGWETPEELAYLAGANKYMTKPRSGEPNAETMGGYTPMTKDGSNEENETDDCFYLLREIWSKQDGTVQVALDGCDDAWARAPYAPITGRRFYPSFLLGFHFIDGERMPQSDVTQLKSLQQEYIETRSDFRKHRRRAVPGIVFDKSSITEESVDNLKGSTTQEYVGIETITNNPDIRSVLFPKLYNQIDPGLYDTTMLNREFEKISGAQEALQQSIQVEKTATEARIQQEGFGARTGSRRDELEDMLTDLSEYTAQLALKTFDQADAERYAGTNAVWIQLSDDQVMYMFDFEIKAGSSGKPKALGDRESWATLMPLMLDLIQRIGAARLAGQEWAAKPWIQLLKETMERLDDHADIEEFLPVVPGMEGPPQQDDGEENKNKSQAKLNEAKTIETLADAIQKVPEVARLPIVRELFGMSPNGQESPQPQAEPPTEQLASI